MPFPFRLSPFTFLLAFFLIGCSSLIPTPPRLAQTAEPPPAPTQIVVPLADVTAAPIVEPPELVDNVDPNPVVTVWVNETSPEHRGALERMQANLIDEEGIYLEFILVDQARLPDLVATAVLSGTLPDLIIHPVEMTAGWVERGILQPAAAGRMIDQLGRETFSPQALDLVTINDIPAAVPLDAWPQILLYRQDWFDQLDLAPPDSYSNIEQAGAQIYRSETVSAQTNISSTLISGLVVPTESDLVSTHQTFEQWALANDCRLIDEKGEVTLLHPNCLEALDFYRDVVNFYSPSDIQTDISAVNAYLAGRTGMIVTSPTTLVYLAGLDERFTPSCPECDANPQYLLENSGVVTRIKGSSGGEGVAFSHYTYLGITQAADQELTDIVVDYWLNDGYWTWLSVEIERKFPLRFGIPGTDPTKFVASWTVAPLAPDGPFLNEILAEIDDDLSTQLSEAVGNSDRWGLPEGHGTLITQIHEDFTIAVVLQEMLSGYFTSSQAVIEGYQRIVDLIPNYAYYIEPTPPDETPEPPQDG